MDRAQALEEVWGDREEYVRSTRHGIVALTGLQVCTDDEGHSWVEVYAGGVTEGGDPHYRIFNPPSLVPDPNGEVEAHGQRWREDPLAALAEVVAQHGGAQVTRSKRRSRG